MSLSIYSASFNQSNLVFVNGKYMDERDYTKMMKAKAKNKTIVKKAKKPISQIKLLPSDIKALLKGVRVFKSLVSFYNNGYRQFGKVYNELTAINDIDTKFAVLKLSILEINAIIKEIELISKANDKSIYAYVEKLSYKMDDANEKLAGLYNAVINSNVINSTYANKEIISGKGRRLGLKILMSRSFDAITNIAHIVEKLQKMSNIPSEIYEKEKIMNYGYAVI